MALNVIYAWALINNFLHIEPPHSQVLNLYRDPTGEKIFSEMNPTRRSDRTQSMDHHSMAVGMSGLTDTEKVALLTSRLTRLEEKLKERDERLTELQSIIKS